MSLHKSYAQALYQTAVSEAASELDAIDHQLKTFVDVLNASDLLNRALTGPVVTSKEKVGVVEQLAAKLGFHALVKNTLVVMAKKGRVAHAQGVLSAFRDVRLAAEGGVQGRVVSAEPLSDSDLSGLAQAFSKKLGKKVAFDTTVDADLLAGLKVIVQGVTYDGTLQSQLQQLRDRLAQI